jgi:predicted amidophosphoribosyltransferase
VKRIQSAGAVDGIVSVPTRPGRIERFEPILDSISKECDIENLSGNFKCISSYPTQKSLSSMERQENIAGVFRYDGNLSGKHIILIDDIVTTGATIKNVFMS